MVPPSATILFGGVRPTKNSFRSKVVVMAEVPVEVTVAEEELEAALVVEDAGAGCGERLIKAKPAAATISTARTPARIAFLKL